MKTTLTISLLACLGASLLAADLPPIPEEMKGFHHASDTHVPPEVRKAMQVAVDALRKDGYTKLDGADGQGVIYWVQKKEPGYWVMCQNYSVSKDGPMVPVVGGYVWVILDAEFRFKEFRQGA